MKQLKILWLLLAVFAFAACGGDDDDDSPARNNDTSVVGNWVKFNPSDNYEINEAFMFRQNGDVFIMIGGPVECYGGTYYTENGVIHTSIKPGKIANFKNIDNFDWWSIADEPNTWDFTYTITGNNIKLKRLQDNQSWSLQKI